jgi:hypothetical protein
VPLEEAKKGLTTESQRAQRKTQKRREKKEERERKKDQQEDSRRRPRACAGLLFFSLSVVFTLSFVCVFLGALCDSVVSKFFFFSADYRLC